MSKIPIYAQAYIEDPPPPSICSSFDIFKLKKCFGLANALKFHQVRAFSIPKQIVLRLFPHLKKKKERSL